MLVSSGPGWNSEVRAMLVEDAHAGDIAGQRSGVNWTRAPRKLTERASAFASHDAACAVGSEPRRHLRLSPYRRGFIAALPEKQDHFLTNE